MRTFVCKWGCRKGQKIGHKINSTKWMAPNKCIGPAKYPRVSPPAEKMSLFPSIIIPHVPLFNPM